MVNFHFSRTPDFDVTLSHVTDFPNDRWALCFRFFQKFRKKSKKVVQKAGTGWCLHLWLIDLKRGHFWSSFRIMRQTTKAHRACPPPQILPAKSDYFPKKKRTGFPRFCFASLNVKSASRNNNWRIEEIKVRGSWIRAIDKNTLIPSSSSTISPLPDCVQFRLLEGALLHEDRIV